MTTSLIQSENYGLWIKCLWTVLLFYPVFHVYVAAHTVTRKQEPYNLFMGVILDTEQ